MKKTFVITLALIGGLVLFGFGYFLGERQVNQSIELVDTFEAPDQAVMLSFETLDPLEVLESDDLYETVFLAQQSLIDTHQSLVSAHQTLRATRETLRLAREAFQESGLEMSLEDRLEIRTKLIALRNLRNDYQETEGLAYQRLRELKDVYDVEHIDLIITTFEEVNVVLHQRLSYADQANLYLLDILTILNSYLES